MLVAQREHARDGGGVRGRDDRKRPAVIERAVVAQHRRDAIQVGDERGRVDGGAKFFGEGGFVHARMITARAADQRRGPPMRRGW
jgi:hypothetical protein